MHKLLLALTFIGSSLLSQSQTVLIQEDFNNGIPSTWQVIDNDGHTLHSSMSAFTNAWVPYVDGTDSCAASSSYFDDELTASDFLILPVQNLLTFSKLSWEARSVDPSFPDSYHVLLSTTDSSVTSFTDTILTVIGEYFQWHRRSVWLDTLGFANQTVYIAFENVSEDRFILLLDDIMLEVSDFASIPNKPEYSYEIYPNPTTDILNIKSNASTKLKVFDLLGKELISLVGTSVDVSALAPGKYLLMIESESGITSKPFIKL